MAMRPTGIQSAISAATATSFHRVQLAATGITIQLTEFGISLNAAPNSTVAPVQWDIERSTTLGTGSAGTEVKLNDAQPETLITTATINHTVDGTPADIAHSLFVPNVSGVIWVAAPGREMDCIAGEFISVINQAALGASISAAVYMVWEE